MGDREQQRHAPRPPSAVAVPRANHCRRRADVLGRSVGTQASAGSNRREQVPALHAVDAVRADRVPSDVAGDQDHQRDGRGGDQQHRDERAIETPRPRPPARGPTAAAISAIANSDAHDDGHVPPHLEERVRNDVMAVVQHRVSERGQETGRMMAHVAFLQPRVGARRTRAQIRAPDVDTDRRSRRRADHIAWNAIAPRSDGRENVRAPAPVAHDCDQCDQSEECVGRFAQRERDDRERGLDDHAVVHLVGGDDREADRRREHQEGERVRQTVGRDHRALEERDGRERGRGQHPARGGKARDREGDHRQEEEQSDQASQRQLCGQ